MRDPRHRETREIIRIGNLQRIIGGEHSAIEMKQRAQAWPVFLSDEPVVQRRQHLCRIDPRFLQILDRGPEAAPDALHPCPSTEELEPRESPIDQCAQQFAAERTVHQFGARELRVLKNQGHRELMKGEDMDVEERR